MQKRIAIHSIYLSY